MALKFKCEHCDTEITSNFIKIGEMYQCNECNNRTLIPKDAEQVENTLIRRSREIEELISRPSIKIEKNDESDKLKDDDYKEIKLGIKFEK